MDFKDFKCINEPEIKSKGLQVPSLLDLDIDINSIEVAELNHHRVLIYDTLTGELTFHKVHVPRLHEKEIWFITENSFTDNLDHETFTYFKFKV